LRDREVTVKEHEQRVREEDLALRKLEIAKAAWRSPLTVAIIAAALAGFSNVVVVTINGILGRQLEDARAESGRILEMIKTGDADKAAENLLFLADAGLISDQQRVDAIRGFLKTRSPGQGPSLPSPSGSSVARPASMQQQSDRITAIGVWEGPVATFRDDFAIAINHGYTVQEQWPRMLTDNRAALLPNIKAFHDFLALLFMQLARLRTEYSSYSDIVAALTYPNQDELLKTTDDFYRAIEALPPVLPQDYDTKVVHSSGALKIQLKLAQEWHSALQHIATENLKNLTTSTR
jgi:hypothetical protein